MQIIRAISLTLAFLIPAAAIASPQVRSSCVDPSCCPGCPLCHHAGHQAG